MNIGHCCNRLFRAGQRGFTLTEVVVSLAVAVTGYAGVIGGYIYVSDRAQWSAHSMAAQALAMESIEQVRAAQWDTQTWPNLDEAKPTNAVIVVPLDVPLYSGTLHWATNYLTISNLSTKPPLRLLRADCVWNMPSRRAGLQGPFTNTIITYRAADQ
jgi:prepilin-type N-terminal cleavage/methylation domain-containing protein